MFFFYFVIGKNMAVDYSISNLLSSVWAHRIGRLHIFAFLLVEAFLCAFIIKKVNYTEIDWIAYTQEVGGFLNGSRNYTELRGDTGPLVYPAGFVYIYSVLYWIYKWAESDLTVMQFVFGGLYLANLYVVFQIYKEAKQTPFYALCFITFTAYRVHSIFVLRLFNDPVAMFLAYVSVALFQRQKWLIGCIMFSLAVSIKMNVLLFAPGLFVLLLYFTGWKKTFALITVCGIIQLVLALPFLLFDPIAYIRQSFDFGRVFFYKWTVNWRFVPEAIFLSRPFHASLLALHLSSLALVAYFCWKKLLNKPSTELPKEDAPRIIPFILFTSNFCGIVFSRSLHYQFYVWYFHTIPFLLWSTRLPTFFRIVFILLTEYAWNTYPSTSASSLTLEVTNVCILLAIFMSSVVKTSRINYSLTNDTLEIKRKLK